MRISLCFAFTLCLILSGCTSPPQSNEAKSGDDFMEDLLGVSKEQMLEWERERESWSDTERQLQDALGSYRHFHSGFEEIRIRHGVAVDKPYEEVETRLKKAIALTKAGIDQDHIRELAPTFHQS